MTPEQEEVLRRRLDAAQSLLDNLPPEQREEVERQLKETLEQVASGPGADAVRAAFGDVTGGAVGVTGTKHLPYRGDLRAVAGVGGAAWFVTAHPEGRPTALCRLDADSLRLTELSLPCGGVALAADGETLIVAGTDQRLYTSSGKAPKPLGNPLPAPVAALTPVAGDRLAVVAGPHLLIVSRADGSVLQTLELPDAGTAVAADRTGQWLVAGTAKGTVAVFDGQDKPEFEPAESEKLHDGAVTALLFEPEELRFFSTGADHKLLSTHARGRLEPEDKGRDNGHDEPVAAMAWVTGGERFVTGGRDAVLKSWPRAGNVKPVTLKDGVGPVVGLAVLTAYNRPRLAVACADNSVRFVALEADGRLGEVVAKVYGAADRAKNELGQHDPKRREKVLKELAGWDDAAGLTLVAGQMTADADHHLRLLAAQLLAASANPRAVALLEPAVGHRDDKVRAEAFKGLQNKLGPADPKPIDLALKTGQPDVGVLAVKALEPLAAADDQALARLTAALDHPAWDVRKAALAALAGVFAADPPRAGLTALGSKFGDVRAAALARFYERKLLADPRVTSAVRRRLEDDDAGVRRVAFLVSVLARRGLANYLRARDPDLHRQLSDLQGSDNPLSEVPAADRAKLGPDDFDVPLQATAARSLDTALRGARALAVLGDPRAFGLLLQLSREDDAAARVEVCRALAALGDPRAVTRVRSLLADADGSVRDAAYSALAAIQATDPLAVAAAGLHAAAEDVRRRGLETLAAALRKTPTGPARDLLAFALSDAAPAVRREAWKAALGLKVDGGGEATLRFALRSSHADVRREALTEVTAQAAEPWAGPLLAEFLNDPAAELRAEAFAQTTKKTKDVAPLAAALGSRYADVRRLAIDALVKKPGKPAQALLATALHDPDRDLRRLALAALVDADAGPALLDATRNEHPDVRAGAAAALARHGDPAALRPLLDLATAAEPTEAERGGAWLANAEAALLGLADLGDPAAADAARFLLNSKHARLRTAAAEALAWTAPAADTGLRAALSHDDPEVRQRAAFGLAALGDPAVMGHLLGDEFATVVGPARLLAAEVALGDAGDRLAAHLLDHADETVRRRALLVHLLLELRDGTGSARRCLECLSAKAARTRLAAARGLELYADPAAFRLFVSATFNERGEEAAWKVAPETVDTLAAVLAGGPPRLKARAVGLLAELAGKEQAGWDQAWAAFAARYAADIAAAEAAAPPRTTSQLTPVDLRELAFGAYIGLVREQGGGAATPAVVRVRQSALRRVFAIASADAGYARAARPVLSQSLADPNQPVRAQAFDHLLALGTDRPSLGAEALESGHTDLGVKGLELLAAGGGDEVLERVMLGRTDDLATEAAKLLADRRGRVPVAAAALEAASEGLRQLSVQWLAAAPDAAADARAALRAALASRYRKVREAAAFELAGKKDTAAFDALVAILNEAADAGRQKRAAEALTALGDKRAAAAFLDRIEFDPAGTAVVGPLFEAAGGFRDEGVADRLLALADRRKDWRTPALAAVLTVSGFDQEVEDRDAERPETELWEAKQHPRRPVLFARLLDRLVAVGATDALTDLLPQARWCRGPEVTEPLTLLAANPDADLRNAAVEALGWRLKHRGGPADALLKALRHKDPATQFYAAEGLARGGRGEGVPVLLSSVDYLDDVGLRARAVLALGELGDLRAIDVLLRLAGEDGHALQEPAAEAVGHLRRSADADKVGRLLERLAKGGGGVARRALVGLRWFDTDAGWKLVRQRATDRHSWQVRETAAEQLGFKDDPATRDLLLKRLAVEDDGDVLEALFRSARRLWGADRLDPHFALLRNPQADAGPDGEDRYGEDVAKAVCDRGDPLRLMEAFPRCPADVQHALEASLLGRADVPLTAAAAALDSADEGTVRLAARLLARSGAADAAAKKAVAAALAKWAAAWADRRAKLDRDPDADDPLDRAADALRALGWAAARAGAGVDKLAELAVSRPNDGRFKPVRLEAVRCLAAVPPTKDVLAAMDHVARGTDPDAREVAAGVLARHDPKRAAALLEPLASDRPSFARLLAGADAPAVTRFVQAVAGKVHYQPVALPPLAAARDVDTLAAVAKDRKSPEAARLGAVEGLGVMAAEAAERVLAAVGAADGDDEDVRKAAWRALRRSKRTRAKIK